MKTGIKGTLSPACSSERDKKSKPRPWRPGSTKTREGRSLLILEFRLLLLKSSIVLESAGNGCGAAARAGIGCEELEAGKAARLSHRAPAVSGSGPSSARRMLSPARALLREFRTFHSWLGIPGSIPSPDPAGTLPNLPWAPFPLPSFGRGAPCVQPGTAGPSQSPGGLESPWMWHLETRIRGALGSDRNGWTPPSPRSFPASAIPWPLLVHDATPGAGRDLPALPAAAKDPDGSEMELWDIKESPWPSPQSSGSFGIFRLDIRTRFCPQRHRTGSPGNGLTDLFISLFLSRRGWEGGREFLGGF